MNFENQEKQKNIQSDIEKRFKDTLQSEND